MEKHLALADLFWLIALPVFLLYRAGTKKQQLIREKPYYRFYTKALKYRLFMSLVFVSIYLFYYGGGDTLDYFAGAKAMKNLFWQHLRHFYHMMTDEVEFYMYWTYFTDETGYPPTHLFRRTENFSVVRAGAIPAILTNGSLIGINLCFGYASFKAVWKLYEVFHYYFPKHEKLLAYAILFFPSPTFWSAGLMKDTLSLIGICFMVFYLHRIFVLKAGNMLTNLLFLFMSGYLVYVAKSYILMAAIPGALLWTNFESISRIQSKFVRVVLFPMVFMLIIVGGFQLYLASGSMLGDYSSDKILERAVVIQQDLSREEAYGSHKFDIGTFEPTLPSIGSKFPIATNAGLYRPYIWEAGNIVMFFSGLENLILLWFTILLIFRLNPVGLIRKIFGRPLLTFCFIFSILMAFSIGLTTPNFGAMVRYKTPLIPFFTAMLFILVRESSSKFKKQLEEEQSRKEIFDKTDGNDPGTEEEKLEPSTFTYSR